MQTQQQLQANQQATIDQQKRGLIDDNKLNRIINDSKQRRSRATREMNKPVNQQQAPNAVISVVSQSQVNSINQARSPPPESRIQATSLQNSSVKPITQRQKLQQNASKNDKEKSQNRSIVHQQQFQQVNTAQNSNKKAYHGQRPSSSHSKSQSKSQQRRKSSHNLNTNANQNLNTQTIDDRNSNADLGQQSLNGSIRRKSSSNLSYKHQEVDQVVPHQQVNLNTESSQPLPQYEIQDQLLEPSPQNDSDQQIIIQADFKNVVDHHQQQLAAEESKQQHIIDLSELNQNPHEDLQNPTILNKEFMENYYKHLNELDDTDQKDDEQIQHANDANNNFQREDDEERNDFEVASNDIQLNQNGVNEIKAMINQQEDEEEENQSQHSAATPYSEGSLNQASQDLNLKNFHSTSNSMQPNLQQQELQQDAAKQKIVQKQQNKRKTSNNKQQVVLAQQQSKAKVFEPHMKRKQVTMNDPLSNQKQKPVVQNNPKLQTIQYDTQATIDTRQVRSKVNTNLASRSKSAYGQRKIQNQQRQINEANAKKYRLDLTPRERLKDDIERKINAQVKEGIKEIVNDKYAELERLLQDNMGGVRSMPSEHQETIESQDNYIKDNSINIQDPKEYSQTIDHSHNNHQYDANQYRTLEEPIQRSSTSIAKTKTLNLKTPTQQQQLHHKSIQSNQKHSSNSISQQKTPKIINQTSQNPKQAQINSGPVTSTSRVTQRSNMLPNKEKAQSIVEGQIKDEQQLTQTVVRVQKKKAQKAVENAFSPDKIIKQPATTSDNQIDQQKFQPAAANIQKKSIVPKLNLNSNSNTKSQKNLATVTSQKATKQQQEKKVLSKQSSPLKPSIIQDKGNKQLYLMNVTTPQSIQTTIKQYQTIRQESSKYSSSVVSQQNLPLQAQDLNESDAHLDLNMVPSTDISPVRRQESSSINQQDRIIQDEDFMRIKQNSHVSDLGEKFNLKTREDYLNFSIEKIWAEMEAIGRNKQTSTELFKDFQEQFYDRKQPFFYNQEECSPTKRLISMKNAVTKHKEVQQSTGLNGSDQYALQYTTCPEKSYVVKPDQGAIDYENFNHRKAHQFVDKIINGKVEKIEIQDQISPIRSSQGVKKNSPVKIMKTYVPRGAMVSSGVSNSGSFVEESEYSPNRRSSTGTQDNKRRSIVQSLGHQYQQDDYGVNEVKKSQKMDADDYIESDDGQIVNITYPSQQN